MPKKAPQSKKQANEIQSVKKRANVGSDSSSEEEDLGRKRQSNNKSQRRQQQSSSEDDSSDDNRPSTSTKANNRRSSLTQNISLAQNNVDIDTLTTNMVKYLLNFSATKIPIKRADISRSVNIAPKKFLEVFEACAKVLKDVYGFEIAEIADGKSAKVYIIYSNFSSAIDAVRLPPDHRSEVSLLFIILSYIYMKGGEIQEAHLIQFLDKIHIDINEPHKVFGDVSKLFREKFPRQLYLKRNKVEIEGVNELQIHVTWGARAELEFNKMEVLKAVAGIMNKSPVSFINQYHDATQGNEEDNMIVVE